MINVVSQWDLPEYECVQLAKDGNTREVEPRYWEWMDLYSV